LLLFGAAAVDSNSGVALHVTFTKEKLEKLWVLLPAHLFILSAKRSCHHHGITGN